MEIDDECLEWGCDLIEGCTCNPKCKWCAE